MITLQLTDSDFEIMVEALEKRRSRLLAEAAELKKHLVELEQEQQLLYMNVENEADNIKSILAMIKEYAIRD